MNNAVLAKHNSFSTNSLFAVPANQEFVYFQSKQKDRFSFLSDLINESFELTVDNSEFKEFLAQHINLALTKGKRTFYRFKCF